MNIQTVQQRLAHCWGAWGTRLNLATNVELHCLELEWGYSFDLSIFFPTVWGGGLVLILETNTLCFALRKEEKLSAQSHYCLNLVLAETQKC